GPRFERTGPGIVGRWGTEYLDEQVALGAVEADGHRCGGSHGPPDGDAGPEHPADTASPAASGGYQPNTAQPKAGSGACTAGRTSSRCASDSGRDPRDARPSDPGESA